MANDQTISAGCTIKYKTTSGGTYAAIECVTSFKPDNLKAGVIPLKRALQDTSRWRNKRMGDPEAGMVVVDCVWNKTEYALVRGWIDSRTEGLYFQLEIDDETTKSKWERIGFIADVKEAEVNQGEDGGDEVVWSFTICITGEPTFTAGS